MALHRNRAAWFALTMGVVLGCGAQPQVAPKTPAKATEASKKGEPEDGKLSATEIAERATPSIVRIEGHGSLGTGFVVRKDGWIATNLHVVAGSPKLEVTFRDGRSFDVVEVMGFDKEHDVALLRIEASDLPELRLDEGDSVHVGDPVIAIGHPLGLSDTVSDGLISAVRDVRPDLRILQISAPIAPGSSGGPLFDSRGQVIGIATAVMREGQNLNFGVPVVYLREVMAEPSPMSFASFVKAMRPRLPTVMRDVPQHQLTMLAGCGEGDLRLLGQLIFDAIQIGAPIYDGGQFAACYHLYLGASHDAETKLSPSCAGPKRALAVGRRKASKASDASAQAWAMRDAFDGLLDVIGRKLQPDED